MASIGAYNFNALEGEFQTASQTVQDITRSGVDGHAFQRFGKRAAEALMQSHTDVADASAAETEADGYKALQGTLVTVVDAIGNTHNNVMVKRVRIRRSHNVINSVGGQASGGNRYVVVAEWILQETEVP